MFGLRPLRSIRACTACRRVFDIRDLWVGDGVITCTPCDTRGNREYARVICARIFRDDDSRGWMGTEA